jgi:hypothetical protein
MATFVYRCPTTGMNVQGWLADDPSEHEGEVYETITCVACTRVHLINRSAGRVLGGTTIRPHRASKPSTAFPGSAIGGRPEPVARHFGLRLNHDHRGQSHLRWTLLRETPPAGHRLQREGTAKPHSFVRSSSVRPPIDPSWRSLPQSWAFLGIATGSPFASSGRSWA